MSPYLIVFLILLGFAIYEYFKKQTQKWLYWIAFGLLTVMLFLRYGQGTDYYSYYHVFLTTPTLAKLSKLFSGVYHGEPAWLIITSLFRTLHIPYEVLVCILALISMYCLHRFIAKFSPLWTVSLLLSFPTLYLTYCMSALRQGLVMMLFLGFMVDWLHRRKIIPYIIMTLVCVLFHSSGAVFLALFAMRWVKLDTRKALLFILLCTAGGFAVKGILPRLSSSLAPYANAGISVLGTGERLVSALFILFLFRNVLDQKDESADKKLYLLLQIYLYGTLIYCFLMWSSLISARFAVYFKAVEIVLFAIAIKSNTTYWGKVAAAYLCALTVVMYLKNVNSYIDQGHYFDTVNIFNYPYISLFQKDIVTSYREIQYDFRGLLP